MHYDVSEATGATRFGFQPLATLSIKFYQLWLSPYLVSLGFRCKYYPSCSCYAEQAFRELHWSKALLYTLWRILRCNPFSEGGYDPLNKHKSCNIDKYV